MSTTTTLEAANKKITAMIKDVVDQDIKFIQLVYDIPQASRFPNPSNRLRWFAFRVNLSCWTMHARRFPYALIDSMDRFNETCLPEHRIHYEVFPYHNIAEDGIKESCKRALEKEAHHVHGNLILALHRATKAYDKAMEDAQGGEFGITQRQRVDISVTREKRMKTALVRAAKALNAAVQAAEAFDQSENVAELLVGLERAIEAQEQSYRSMLEHNQQTQYGLYSS
jgi:hypothetical protein